MDFVVKGVPTKQVFEHVLKTYNDKPFGIAISINPNDEFRGFVHLDTRGYKARWSYNKAGEVYLAKHLDTKAVTEYIMQNYTGEIRDAMIRRIRIESKSILDNYDFSLQALPRLEVLFKEFVKNYELTSYLMKSTAQLFVAQESNLAFMLEYIVAKEFIHK